MQPMPQDVVDRLDAHLKAIGAKRSTFLTRVVESEIALHLTQPRTGNRHCGGRGHEAILISGSERQVKVRKQVSHITYSRA